MIASLDIELKGSNQIEKQQGKMNNVKMLKQYWGDAVFRAKCFE